jgi:prevent-host-death family protein
MRLVGVREAQQQLSGLVHQSQEERIVLTRHGHPVAVLTGVEGRDLEEVLLALDPKFRDLIEKRRRSRKELISHAGVKARALAGTRDKTKAEKRSAAKPPRRR